MKLLPDLIIGGARVDAPLGDAALTVLRAFSGASLAFGHGLGKMPPSAKFVAGVDALGFPAPHLFAWAAGLSELAGGLLLAIGLCTRPAAALACFTMLVAAFGQHASDPFARKELALLYAAIMFAFVIVGCGRFGVDALLRERESPVT